MFKNLSNHEFFLIFFEDYDEKMRLVELLCEYGYFFEDADEEYKLEEFHFQFPYLRIEHTFINRLECECHSIAYVNYAVDNGRHVIDSAAFKFFYGLNY